MLDLQRARILIPTSSTIPFRSPCDVRIAPFESKGLVEKGKDHVLRDKEETDMRTVQAVFTTIAALALGTIARPIPVLASGCKADAASIAAHIFDMSDADADGYLSPDEFADAGLEQYGVSFDGS
jgi:hypothetical protein